MKYVIFGIFGYVFLGHVVFAIVDNKEQWLYNEQKRLNRGSRTEQVIGILFVILWPLIVYQWLKRLKKDRNEKRST